MMPAARRRRRGLGVSARRRRRQVLFPGARSTHAHVGRLASEGRTRGGGSALPWEPIAITSKNAVDVEGDGVQVVWSLNRRPTSDWAREFRGTAVHRSGSPDFVDMPSPDIRIGGTIHWTVPAADLRGAVQYVKDCVEAANEGYRHLLMRRDEERRRRDEEERAKALASPSRTAGTQRPGLTSARRRRIAAYRTRGVVTRRPGAERGPRRRLARARGEGRPARRDRGPRAAAGDRSTPTGACAHRRQSDHVGSVAQRQRLGQCRVRGRAPTAGPAPVGARLRPHRSASLWVKGTTSQPSTRARG